MKQVEMNKGFYTALGTPLDQNGDFCADSMARQIEQQIEAGGSGVIVLAAALVIFRKKIFGGKNKQNDQMRK